MGQLPLFGAGPPGIDARFATVERVTLGAGAWLDVGRGWVAGHERLFERLRACIHWKSERRVMYDRTVEVPRQYAVIDDGDAIDPVLRAMRTALDARYGTAFERVSVALYRDGCDSVAWHGDYVARRMKEALVATVSLGAPRRFMIRPTGGGRSRSISLGWGDLLVMGGTCQRTHQHAVPKVAHADPRIALMFRPRWSEDDPDAAPTGEQEDGAAPPSGTSSVTGSLA